MAGVYLQFNQVDAKKLSKGGFPIRKISRIWASNRILKDSLFIVVNFFNSHCFDCETSDRLKKQTLKWMKFLPTKLSFNSEISSFCF